MLCRAGRGRARDVDVGAAVDARGGSTSAGWFTIDDERRTGRDLTANSAARVTTCTGCQGWGCRGGRASDASRCRPPRRRRHRSGRPEAPSAIASGLRSRRARSRAGLAIPSSSSFAPKQLAETADVLKQAIDRPGASWAVGAGVGAGVSGVGRAVGVAVGSATVGSGVLGDGASTTRATGWTWICGAGVMVAAGRAATGCRTGFAGHVVGGDAERTCSSTAPSRQTARRGRSRRRP